MELFDLFDFTDFNEFNKFIKLIEIMKSIPTLEQMDELCKYNIFLSPIENLSSQGYFKLLTRIQKYHLFATACAHESVDIAMLLYKNDIDMEGVKELMLNYMAEVGSDSNYIIFRWIWEKNQINFTIDEITDCLIKILKSRNLEFIEWFCSLANTVDWYNSILKERIGNEVLEFADSKKDYMVAKYICEQYMRNKHYLIKSE